MRQLRYATLDKGEDVAVREARGQLAFYFRGFSGAARLRAEINRATRYAEVEELIGRIVERGEMPSDADATCEDF